MDWEKNTKNFSRYGHNAGRDLKQTPHENVRRVTARVNLFPDKERINRYFCVAVAIAKSHIYKNVEVFTTVIAQIVVSCAMTPCRQPGPAKYRYSLTGLRDERTHKNTNCNILVGFLLRNGLFTFRLKLCY
jgi:hypothetical protein